MIRGFRQIASLTAVSRVLGLARDVAYSHFFGANQLLDAWLVAFRIPNLSRRLFGEGAASASFIPVYSEALHKDRDQAASLANTVVTVLAAILTTIVLLGQAGIWLYYGLAARTAETKLILSLAGVMLPYMLFICTVAMLAGILNVHRHFAAPAAAPIILNVFIIGTVLLTGSLLKIPTRIQLYCVAIAVLVAGVVQFAMQLWPMHRLGVLPRPAWSIYSEPFKKIIFLMGPMMIGLAATQINTLVDDLVAWCLSGSEEKGRFFWLFGMQIGYPMWRGSVSHLYYAQRLYQLPLGILGISLATAIFPVMSSDAAKGDLDALRKTISKGLCGTVFVALPAAVGLIMVGRPLISGAFEHGRFTSQDTSMVVWALAFYALGLAGYFAQQVLTRAFFALQDSRTPMFSALIAVGANFVLNLTLVWFLNQAGLACATAVCSYLQVAILISVLRRKLGLSVVDGLVRTIVQTLAATAVMGGVGVGCLFALRGLPDRTLSELIRLAAVVPLGVLAFGLTARLLRIEALSLLTARATN